MADNSVKHKKIGIILAVILVILFTSLFYYPVIKDLGSTVISEDDWFGEYFYAGLTRKSIVEYFQLPLNTPYLSGGYPYISHPWDYTFNPFLLFILPFGEVSGLRIAVFLTFLLGALGMFYLTKSVLKFNLLGAVFSSLTFIFCNWGAYEVVDGNIHQYIYYYFLPWLLAFFKRSADNGNCLLFSCLILSFYIMNSGLSLIVVLLFLFMSAFLDSINISSQPKINPSIPIALLIILGLSILLSAVKIIPMYNLYSLRAECIHLPYENIYSKVSVATDAFHASLNMDRLWRGLFTGYLGYSSMYLGYLPVIIAFFSILLYFKENLRYLILLVVFTLIAFGKNSPIDIFKIIWHIHPVVHGIWRLDKYFCFFIPFFISIIAGRFFLIVEKRRKLYLLAILLAIISVANIYIQNQAVFKKMVYEYKPKLKIYSDFFQVKIEDALLRRERPGFFDIHDLRDYQPFWLLLNQNLGVVDFNWNGNLRLNEKAIPRYILPLGKQMGREKTFFVEGYANLPKDPSLTVDLVSKGKINPDYKGEAFFLNGTHKVSLDYFSPNVINLTVDLEKPDTLVINQNYHDNWKADKGVLGEQSGLLAVGLRETGRYKIKLSYIPQDFYIGLFI
ncbi:MAG: hypothetical protein PHY88_02250, partial [Candidatus Omnitrophica bacterium]|nr:hypothetical protein [Candidatus Omnitrophota bacterium]